MEISIDDEKVLKQIFKKHVDILELLGLSIIFQTSKISYNLSLFLISKKGQSKIARIEENELIVNSYIEFENKKKLAKILHKHR